MEDSSFEDSVTEWISQLREGDEVAAERLWKQYFQRLVAFAERKLGSRPKRVADGEDIAVSAFDSLWRGLSEGRFPDLADRDDLWRLLVAITAKKAVDQIRKESRQKRGGGSVRGHSIFGNEQMPRSFDQFLAQSPTPAVETILDEAYEGLLAQLRDDTLREIAVSRMQGFSNEEIASKTGISLRSVERKLKLIRDQWSRAAES